MSSITEQDLELLEAYLDGQLPAEARESVVSRLEADTSLAAALEALRAERFIRAQAFESLEPDDHAAQQFAWNITQSLKLGRQGDVGSNAHRRIRFLTRAVSTVAASIVVGFLVGWATRGIGGSSVSTGGQAFPAHQAAVDYRVPLTNAQGEIIALQDFETPERAREYARRSKLGVAVKPGHLTHRAPDGRIERDQPALLISEVFPNTVASRAGLLKGDIILAFGGVPIRDGVTFVDAVSRQNGPATVKVLRDKQTRELTVDLRPE